MHVTRGVCVCIFHDAFSCVQVELAALMAVVEPILTLLSSMLNQTEAHAKAAMKKSTR